VRDATYCSQLNRRITSLYLHQLVELGKPEALPDSNNAMLVAVRVAL
jgi:hypothetical protein